MSESDLHPTSKLRNARACEACRASKSRCLRSSQQYICARCQVTRSQCIVRPKARPMRARNAPASNKSKNIVPKNDFEFSIDLPPVTAPDTEKDIDELHQHHKRVLGDEDEDLGSQPVRDSQPEMIKPRKLDFKEAERLLLAFRDKAPLFPFVIIPEDATVSSLSKASPFLLLAVLAVASRKDASLNYQLDHEFRRILSEKVVMEGQKSLDFLQGMILYISWYPIHTRPRNNQALMYMDLTISLVTGLGLDKEIPNENGFNAFSTQGLIEYGAFTDAAKRAFLGCYYLSTALSTDFQKPNNLQYRNVMDTHAMTLPQNGCSGEIYSIVKLFHLLERMDGVQKRKNIASYDLTTDMNIQIFLNELQEWRATTATEIRNMSHIALAENFTTLSIFSHELGLLRRPYPSKSTPSSTQTHQTSCLTACRVFFETLLSISESQYPHLSIVQYNMIIQATLVLSRLTFLMAATFSWDASTTRSNIPMVMYLDALCYRFDTLSTAQATEGTTRKSSDALEIFAMVLRSTKRSYMRRVEAIQPSNFIVDPSLLRGPHCPMKDASLRAYFNQELDLELDSGYGGGLSGSSAGSADMSQGASKVTDAPLYHDLWATMTCTWVKEF